MEDENTKHNSESPNQKSNQEVPLFRKEALEHRKGSYLGQAIIISPISFSVWTIGIAIIALIITLFVVFGKYARRQEVLGILVPNKGLIHIHASAPGIVINKFVQQGDKVAKGQLLYLISTERHTLTEQGTAEQQVETLEKQVTAYKDRLILFEKKLPDYKQLLEQKFISEIEYQKYYDDYLSIQISLREAEQKLIQAKEGTNHAIRAPEDGVISALIAFIGDYVAQDRTLATIIPKGAVLQGMLFVRSNAIGFVKVGQEVLLKYDAFPYQKFGLYESTVASIDKSVLFLKDIDLPININPEINNPYSNDPFYRVIVGLKEQYIMAYGNQYLLTPGMTFRASIIGEERTIWQWILDPIYSFRGTLASP